MGESGGLLSAKPTDFVCVHAGIVETTLTAEGLRHLPKAPNERSESV